MRDLEPTSWRAPATAHTLSALLAAAVLAGCQDAGAPLSNLHTLSGRVRLVANLFDLSGNPTGKRLLSDASGVPVYVLRPNGTTDSTRTHAGGYEFRDLAPGRYRVSSWVVPSIVVPGHDVVLGSADVVAADTLVLAPVGPMHTAPNPAAPEGLGLEFTANVPQRYSTEVLTLGRAPVWAHSDSSVGGFNHVHWDGDDLTEHVTPDGAYWAIVHVNGQMLYNLIFWAHGQTPPSPGNCGHITADGLYLEEHGVVLVTDWRGVQHGDIHTCVGSVAQGLHLAFLRPDSTAFAVADTCPQNHMSWTLADTSMAAVLRDPGVQWTFHILGKKSGSTTLVLDAWHQEHIHISSQPIPVTILPPTPGATPKPWHRKPR